MADTRPKRPPARPQTSPTDTSGPVAYLQANPRDALRESPVGYVAPETWYCVFDGLLVALDQQDGHLYAGEQARRWLRAAQASEWADLSVVEASLSPFDRDIPRVASGDLGPQVIA